VEHLGFDKPARWEQQRRGRGSKVQQTKWGGAVVFGVMAGTERRVGKGGAADLERERIEGRGGG
jgi:hypothetical protein